MRVDDDHCLRFAGVQDDVKGEPSTLKMMGEINEDLESTLFPELRQITKMEDGTTDDMHDVCNYIYWA